MRMVGSGGYRATQSLNAWTTSVRSSSLATRAVRPRRRAAAHIWPRNISTDWSKSRPRRILQGLPLSHLSHGCLAPALSVSQSKDFSCVAMNRLQGCRPGGRRSTRWPPLNVDRRHNPGRGGSRRCRRQQKCPSLGGGDPCPPVSTSPKIGTPLSLSASPGGQAPVLQGVAAERPSGVPGVEVGHALREPTLSGRQAVQGCRPTFGRLTTKSREPRRESGLKREARIFLRFPTHWFRRLRRTGSETHGLCFRNRSLAFCGALRVYRHRPRE